MQHEGQRPQCFPNHVYRGVVVPISCIAALNACWGLAAVQASVDFKYLALQIM